jgi:prepilin-type N-terminal cleavage/methylation domain-containing protein
MATRNFSKSGFTIVELLIVVVVIAILAAITIVAYNGIQNRARQSAAQSNASQAAKSAASYHVLNSTGYPEESTFIADFGLQEGDGVAYQYSVSSDRQSYCLTTTVNGVSYFTSNASTNPTSGGCPGHNANGQTAVTNLVTNPSFETNESQAQNIGNASGRSMARTAVSDAYVGDYVFRVNQPTSGVSMGGYGVLTGSVPAGQYTASLWVRSNQAITIMVYLEGSAAKSPNSGGTATLAANTWRRIQLTFNATTAGTVKVGYLTSGTSPAANTRVDMDAVMLTAGSPVVTYGDGSTANWTWTGTPHASTSTGIPTL